MVSLLTKILVPIVAIIAVGGLCLFVLGADEECRYDYEVELTDSFVGYNGIIEKPGAGKQYAIVHVTAANDSVAGGASTNPYIWEWTIEADGITYTHTLDHYGHPEHGEADKEIAMGDTGSFVVVFEIDKTLSKADLDVNTKYNRDLVVLIHDDSLIP